MVNIRNSQKILVIDDSDSILLLTSDILGSEGYDVVTCSSAKQGLELADETVDLVILDLMMLDMDGKEFLEVFRRNYKFRFTPVIVSTAKQKSPEEITQLFKLGINDYLNKPFITQELLARVKVHIRTKILETRLLESNKSLKRELTENKRLLTISMEYASELERYLLEKMDRFSLPENECVNYSLLEELKKQIEENKAEKERLIEQNEKYMKKIEDMNNVFSTIVMHDTLIEDELSTKLDEVTISAITDPLTKIYNRNQMNTSLSAETEAANKFNTSLCLIMFDIDFFKNVNDTFGHEAGDEVLKGITNIVDENLREHSIFSRWGGEEFLILLPGIELKSAKRIAERLRGKIEENKFKDVGSVTCSFGVTQYILGEDIEFFLKRVDNCLYKAKAAGRNCVKFYV